MLYVLPDSAGDILVVQATQSLTQDDYQTTLIEQIKKQLKPGHQLRVMLYLDHALTDIDRHSNWQPDTFFKHCDATILRMAIVSDTQWQEWANKFESKVVSHFPVSKFLEALHWLDESDI